MKHGHVTGTKRERTPQQATIERHTAMAAAIAQQLAGKTVEELLAMTPQTAQQALLQQAA